jgi:multicomponent Na+:H+ antiporter subunit E
VTAREWVRRLPGIAWLTLVWVLLWGTFSALSLVGGLLVGVLVTALFRMPLARDRLPLRPLPLLGLVCFLAYDLAVSGAQVSWQTLRRGPGARGAIVAVPLLSGSDRVVTIMANALSLSPGTMTLQIDHEHELWYVYALGPRDRAAVERVRRQALDLQRRVLAAFGAPAEIAEVKRRMAQDGRRR